MKTLFLTIALSIAALASAGPRPANYAGTWMLDMKQSRNLPGFYQRVQSHKLIITQDEQHLQVDVELDLGQKEPDRLNFVYNLDGSETRTETMMRGPNGRMNLPTTLKATVGEGGRVRIIIAREINMGEKKLKGITTEDWQLSPDGKTLIIHRADEGGPMGKTEMDMVFVKS